MPSVLRTVSFSPVFVVVSLSRQRVKPLVSMMTAFWASVDRTEVRSKCTLLTGSTRSTYEEVKGITVLTINQQGGLTLFGLKPVYSYLTTKRLQLDSF